MVGRKDKNGREICLGDTVKFRCKRCAVVGCGIVIEDDRFGYAIKDTRTNCKSRNAGRIYPFYDDAIYEICEDNDDEEM